MVLKCPCGNDVELELVEKAGLLTLTPVKKGAELHRRTSGSRTFIHAHCSAEKPECRPRTHKDR